MSELICEVIEIKDLETHSNADSLLITHIYSFPCIVKRGEIQVADKAVYFPVEACLPDKPLFSFMWKGKENPTDKNRTIRALRLRGVFSMGLVMSLNKLAEAYPEINFNELQVGQNVAELLGVTKYEEPEPICMNGDNESTPEWFIKYTDIQNLRKYNDLFIPGEGVVITEKIHGCCSRYIYRDNKFYIGSHNNTKKLGGNDVWNVVAKKLNLEEMCKEYQDLIFFGEVYGQVQKGYSYGFKNDVSFILFDIYDINQGKFLSYNEFLTIAVEVREKYLIKQVPVLYCGPWTSFEKFEEMADGTSMEAEANKKELHNREGFVIRLFRERYNDEIGRVVLKLHGQDYLVGSKREK